VPDLIKMIKADDEGLY